MAGKGEGPAIGIDLGTTYSCVGVWQHDRVEIIANDQGNRTTPSYVAFTDTESLIGDMAKNQVAMNPTNTVFSERLRVFLFFIFYFWVYVLGSEFVLLLFLFKTHLDLNFIWFLVFNSVFNFFYLVKINKLIFLI